MANKELIDYVKGVRAQGYKDEQIINKLKESGYSDEDINRTFDEMNKEFNSVLVLMTALFVVLVGVIIGLIVIGAKDYFANQKANAPCNLAAIEIYRIGDKSSLCETNDKVMLMIKNTGTVEINKLKYVLKGTESTSEEVKENLNLAAGDIFPIVLQKDPSLGDFYEISVVPFMDKSCSEKAVTSSEVGLC